jgi:DNA-binding NarL/FixJ family response regulator
VRVLVVDARRLTGEAVAAALAAQQGITSAGVASDLEGALELCAERRPDVVIVEPEIDAGRGLAIRRLLDAAPGARAIVLTDGRDDIAVARSVEGGAAGHVVSSEPIAVLADTVRRVGAGEETIPTEVRRRLLLRLRHLRAQEASDQQRAGRLTRREVEILQLMANGMAGPQVADSLGISPATVRTHLQNIITKLGVHSRTEALAHAIRHGRVRAAT